MDFADSPADLAYRERAAAWLAANAPAFEEPDTGRLSVFGARTTKESVRHVEQALAWQARKYADGWAGIGIPEEYGGAGGDVPQKLLFAEEEGRHRLPLDAQSVTMGMIVPTLSRWGTAEQRERYLTPLLAGKQLSCQLFSEPDAGSDLAAIRTTARRTADGWRINGQKIWTSYAQYASFGYLLARSEDAPRHHGLTAFLVDLKQPGVTVRPLKQATGAHTFNEVFFDDAVVAADAVLGEPGQGWEVAMTTLMAERYSLEPEIVCAQPLLEMLGTSTHVTDPTIRRQLADVHTIQHILGILKLRLRTAANEGRPPGPEGSITKLLSTDGQYLAADTAIRALGPDGVLENSWTELLTGALGLRIGGGTDEIMKNVIAERVLGLPREPRVGQH
ncbi:acyl-CoA dehydrogenase family protein [Prescottella soli]|uniref:Acyl-CoA dehydrogenase family protein n=1 Tax=Prescottella soli TaxID=1543852 RepID=A0ABW9FPU0_9NOCA